MRNSWDLRWELHQLLRFVRRDRRWCVELYDDLTQDPGKRPSDEPIRRWILSDRQDAVAFAESLSGHLVTHGPDEGLPEP